MILSHLNTEEEIVRYLCEAMNKHLELKGRLTKKIIQASGGEQIALTKKYNGLFVYPFGKEPKLKRGDK